MTPLLAMAVDPWILAFSAITFGATIFMGFWSAKKSKTASDFFVAGRSVSVGWNASAISGEYLSAASFMGVAGMVMSSGYDALWYPVCYACGYLFLLLFIAGPLRRFGAYTIPDFAEGRFDSPVFRKIAVVFVLFIGFFYTMPQMKGAGTTLAYIFPGLPYQVGVLLVGAVITLNVALGGMKGITLVQAFQYWAKMFAISVPIFVLMAVYGDYGKQLGENGAVLSSGKSPSQPITLKPLQSEVSVGLENPIFRERVVYLRDIVRSLATGQQKPVPAWLESFPEAEKRGGSPLSVSLNLQQLPLTNALGWLERFSGRKVLVPDVPWPQSRFEMPQGRYSAATAFQAMTNSLWMEGIAVVFIDTSYLLPAPTNILREINQQLWQSGITGPVQRKPLPEKAPADSNWLSPFGPLTTKAAKAAKPSLTFSGKLVGEEVTIGGEGPQGLLRFVAGKFDQRGRIHLGDSARDALLLFKTYAIITAAKTPGMLRRVVRIEHSPAIEGIGIEWKQSEPLSERDLAELFRQRLETNGITVIHEPGNVFKAFLTKDAVLVPVDTKPYALLYTYSLIIALVCGTAGLPHILVRFYTNPDGVAAKRTTMWVMILIGVFYLFPPVFGVMGRNLMPQLYEGVGAKGTDKVVLELPRILNDRGAHASGVQSDASRGGPRSTNLNLDQRESGATPDSARETRALPRGIPWGSILSGVTCAGAFAAFMSTFSGLLVSMTGALAHDVYGRMFRPKSTPQQRLRAFKICTVLIGGIAIVLGCFVEPLEINFMVGQAFAIAAASYFPLLFMSVWWRSMTMRGAAIGMLSGGLCALAAVTLTNVSNLALDKGPMGKIFAGFAPLNNFWAGHPLLRILCEQPAIWTVPLAIGLMIAVSKFTRKEVPNDVRMKMLVLHAPEKLGLKQEYIQEHQHGH